MKISRIWAMPNKWTFTIKPIRELLQREINGGLWCDPFAGENSPAQVKNDLNGKCEFCLDSLEFLKTRATGEFDGVLLDPPYSMRQASECYQKVGMKNLEISPTSMKYWADVKSEISRIIKPLGKAICFGWSSMGLGKNRGFEMKEILLVPHGGSKNDTICTVEIKKQLF